MGKIRNQFAKVGGIIHRHFLLLLLAAYLAGAACPALGLASRGLVIAQVPLPGGMGLVTLPMLLLAGLLFNAGLGADPAELAGVARKPLVVMAGLIANTVLPLILAFALFPLWRYWHDPDEAQTLLLGFGVVASMPIAGSSTAWSQNANGNVALSLGLVVLSTLLSPLTTPLTLQVFATLATGRHAAALACLSGQETGLFLIACVVAPSLAGMMVRQTLGRERAHGTKRSLRLFNSLAVLFLCYANASTALPQMVAEPDWDFLVLVVGVVAVICFSAFTVGWLLARLLGADEAQKRALMFGLGMNNNGTGMVLACTALSKMPGAVLPVLAYNLVQHLVAGGVNRSLTGGTDSV